MDGSTISDLIESLHLTIENVPNELQHYFAEIKTFDEQIQGLHNKLRRKRREWLASRSAAGSTSTANAPVMNDNITPEIRTLIIAKEELLRTALKNLKRHLSRLDEDLNAVEEEAAAEGIDVEKEFRSIQKAIKGRLPDLQTQQANAKSHTPHVKKGKRNKFGPDATEGDNLHTNTDHIMTAADDANGMDDGGGDEQKYCLCNRVSFGEMIACDNEECPYEWFHLECVGLKSIPKSSYFCPVCAPNFKKSRK